MKKDESNKSDKNQEKEVKPYKYSKAVLRNLELIATKKVGNVTSICKGLGISRSTFYEWMKEHPEFAQVYNDAKESLYDFTESQLYGNVKKGDQRAIEYVLNNKRQSEFDNPINIKHDVEERMLSTIDKLRKLKKIK